MTTFSDLLDKFLNPPAGRQGGQEGLRLVAEVAERVSANPLSASLRAAKGGLLVLVERQGSREELVLVCSHRDPAPAWVNLFIGDRTESGGVQVWAAPCSPVNIPALQAALPNLRPKPMGMAPSFGFGDRTGLATPGHVKAMNSDGEDLVPIFAQQSIREMTRTERTPIEVMADATWGAFRAGWRGPVGADADHLMTPGDVDETVAAGFTFFTIDPSAHVDQRADDYTPAQVDQFFQKLIGDRVPGAGDILDLYGDRIYDLAAAKIVMEKPVLKRAAVKYGRALAHIYHLAGYISKTMGGGGFELEISVDETDQPTTIAEHLFIAQELKRHGIPVVSLAPRFIGDFEKGIDYRGDVNRFKEELVHHAAIAEEYGPYKISLHSGSDKFGVYPLVRQITGQAFHVKTAGTSYLEALRTACRANPDFFREIVSFSRRRFDIDRATYHISAGLEPTPPPKDLAADDLERVYLNEDNGRQILHVTYGSVLTAKSSENGSGYRFRDRLLNLLRDHRDLHEKVLAGHLGKHLRLLSSRNG